MIVKCILIDIYLEPSMPIAIARHTVVNGNARELLRTCLHLV
jgi:hypothetical protein